MGCGSSTSVNVNEAVETDTGDRKPSVHDGNTNANSAGTHTNNKLRVARENVTNAAAVGDRTKLSVGERVHVLGYTGNVRYIGAVPELGQGEWVGLELDHEHPQGSNGSVNGVEYFSCRPRHGLLTRRTAVFHHTDVDTIAELSSISPRTVALIQTTVRRFLAKIRLKKFQQRSGLEKQIDAFVLKTPDAETESIERLGKYLTSPWQGDRNRAYAIFRWLSFNIAYDVDGFFGRSAKKGNDAESVLRNKLSVCAGYANLFHALGKVAGLDIHIVNGYAKGYGFEPGQQFKDTNHAWNVLQVNGEWFVSDATWGSGYVGNDRLFERRLSMAMFLMDPEYAIYSHLPADEKWQLLDKPVTKEEFEKLVVPSGKFHEMGVEILSHKESIYEVDADHIEMMFYSPSLKVLRGSLKSSSGGEVEGRKRTQLLPCGVNKVKLRAQFPAKGTYKLNVNVTDAKEDSSWHHGVEYTIHAKRGVGEDQGGFPQLGNHFYTNGFHLDQPLENIVSQDGKACISLQSYNAQIAKITGNLHLQGNDKALKQEFDGFTFCFPEKTDNGFKIQVHLPLKGIYDLKLFAKFSEEGHSDSFICAYYINALSGVGPIAGFPRMSEKFDPWGLQLIEPRQNIYSHDGRASVQLRSPEDVSVVGYLAKGGQNLDNSLSFSYEKNGVSTVLAHTPELGVFKLNIFGKKNGINKTEYLATFMVKSDKATGANPGFPYLKDEFKDWGLELVDHLENITTRDKHVVITFSNPRGIAITSWLFDKNDKQIGGPCAVETLEHRTTTTCELPAKGRYKLNVFGANPSVDSTKRVFLCTYKVLYSD